MRKTLFISDLHLDESRPDISVQFLNLLANRDPAIDALYILGDLFEVWIGDDEGLRVNHSVIQALKKATSAGLPIYIMHGNRDFLIGKRFLRETGCQLLPDEAKLLLYNTPVLLMHGDTLCTRDIAYFKARKKARNRFLQQLFLWLPLRTRKKFAAKMRSASMQHVQATAAEIMDVTPEEVERIMQKHAVNHLIHGHTHRLGIHQFAINDAPAMRIVLGAWHHRGSVLMWNEAGSKELVEL